METVFNIFLLLGGIGLFLYGINFLSASLKEIAGDKMRDILEKTTNKGIFAVLVGALVTVLVQSSGATSVMVVGFVNAGMMELFQAINVMLGANIGTTVTAQIIAFKLENIAPLILFVGLVLYMFIKNRTVRKIGSAVLAFGLLFVGIFLMGQATEALPLEGLIKAFIENFSNPFLCILFGMLVTAVIQSSSASIGILQVLVGSAGASVGLSSLVFIILGMNIGAAAPVVLASLAGKRSAKRTALADVITKITGVAVVTVIMLVLPDYVKFFENISPGDVPRQIANFHLAFNLVSTAAVLPLVRPIEKLMYKILPNDAGEDKNIQKLLYISPEGLVSPSVAVSQAKREIERMAGIARDNLKLAIDSFFEQDVEATDRVFECEKTINFLNHEITAVLVKLHGKSLPDADLEKVGMMFRVVSDVERLGDHAENIAEYTLVRASDHSKISPDALDELKRISARAMECVDLSIDTYMNSRFDMLDKVSEIEEDVDKLQEDLIENHIVRLKNNECDPRGGVIFTDMTTDLERCSDHAINIAFAINGEKTTVQMKKAYVIARGSDDN